MSLKHLVKEAKYYNKLDGSLKRMGTKFILAKTPLRNIVNKKAYAYFYNRRIKSISKKLEPEFLQIENTNICNAKCIMCPHTHMQRKQRIMNQKQFEKIVNNVLKDYPKIKTLIISGFGEPFVDKEIARKINFLNKHYSKLKIDIYTNASLLNKDVSEELLKLKIHKINFSLNGTRATYKKIMGLDYEKVSNNVLYFIRRRNELKKIFPLVNISLMILKENQNDVSNFQKFWLNNSDSIMVYAPSDWAGKQKINYATSLPFKRKRWPCRALWRNITVDVYGNVIMCCRDYESHIKFGNLLKEHTKEIFEGEKMRSIRKKQLMNDFSMPICNKCDNVLDSSLDWW